MTTIQTLDCGHDVGDGGTAYKEADGERWSMCYGCAYIETMDDIVLTGIEIQGKTEWRLPTLYMDRDGKRIITWDGQFVGHITRTEQRHVFAERNQVHPEWERRHIDVKITYGADVVHAYGTGAPGEYCSLRRRKSDVK